MTTRALTQSKSIPLAKPVLGEQEQGIISTVLRSGWVTQGPMVESFEARIAEYVGAEHAVAVSSGTAALHLALLSLGVGPGDEVIVPSLTFVATANAVRLCGADVVFVDVDANTFNLSPESVEAAVSKKTRVIIAVDQFGLPADLDSLGAVADRCGCVLLEDAACALGSTYQGRRVGAQTRAGCFSFHPRKIITTGEGGMIVTDDSSLADRMRSLRSHGHDGSDGACHHIGFNYRLSDIHAAVGIAQMNRLDEILRRRRQLGGWYDAAMSQHPYLRRTSVSYRAQTNYQSHAICLDVDAPLTRGELASSMLERSISVKSGIGCIHHQPAYRDIERRVSLSQSERTSESMILVPLYCDMEDEDLQFVVDALFAAFGLASPEVKP